MPCKSFGREVGQALSPANPAIPTIRLQLPPYSPPARPNILLVQIAVLVNLPRTLFCRRLLGDMLGRLDRPPIQHVGNKIHVRNQPGLRPVDS